MKFNFYNCQILILLFNTNLKIFLVNGVDVKNIKKIF